MKQRLARIHSRQGKSLAFVHYDQGCSYEQWIGRIKLAGTMQAS
jgi:hypothetical protein